MPDLFLKIILDRDDYYVCHHLRFAGITLDRHYTRVGMEARWSYITHANTHTHAQTNTDLAGTDLTGVLMTFDEKSAHRAERYILRNSRGHACVSIMHNVIIYVADDYRANAFNLHNLCGTHVDKRSHKLTRFNPQ